MNKPQTNIKNYFQIVICKKQNDETKNTTSKNLNKEKQWNLIVRIFDYCIKLDSI